MKAYFINEAIEKGISDYLNSKNSKEGILYNSFLVVVIRMLINIYGELDIINPYKVKNEEAFDTNLMKYGATEDMILNLKILLDGFLMIEKKNETSIKREENIYFIEVQKKVIDLFNLKRLNYGVTESDTKEFFDLLYTPGTTNELRLSYNYLNSDNIYEVAEYYKNSMKLEKEEEAKGKKNLLGFDVYNYFNYSIADLSKMNDEEINKLNSQIYKTLDIQENAMNKDYLLEEKMKELISPKKAFSTGNGYIDILIIMSIIVTGVMVVIIFATLVF